MLRGLAAAAALALPAGCASLGLPLGADEPALDPVVTGSITPAAAPAPAADAVDPSDWEAVRIALLADAAGPLAWSNPDTGTTGTLSAQLPAADADGRLCRDFSTTLNDYRGVRRYHGEACRFGEADWRLLRVVPEDATLS
jgi:hypothetical protein